MPSSMLIARQAIASSPDPAIQAAVDRINTFGPYGYEPNLTGNAIFTASEHKFHINHRK